MSYSQSLYIHAGSVGSSLTDFPVMIDLSELDSSFWTTTNNGEDLRVSAGVGGTSFSDCPTDLVYADTGTEKGFLWVKVPSIPSDDFVELRLTANGTDSRPANGDTLGRNNVWSDYEYVGIPYTSFEDRTGNGATATNTGSPTFGAPSGTDSEISGGGMATFNGSNRVDITGLPNVSTLSGIFTMMAATKQDVADGNNSPVLLYYDTISPSDWATLTIDDGDHVAMWDGGSGNGWVDTSPLTDPGLDWFVFHGAYNGGTERKVLSDGDNKGTDNPSSVSGRGFDSIRLGADASANGLEGKIGLVYLRGDYLSDDWLAAESANLRNNLVAYTTPVWITAASFTPTDTSSGWEGYTVRQRIEAAQITGNSGKVRLTFQASGTGLEITDCYIGEAASSDAFDFNSAPTQITFNSGSDGFDIGADATIVSDEVIFPHDGSNPLIVAFHVPNASSKDTLERETSQTGWTTYFKETTTTSDASTQNATGYTTDAADAVAVTTIEFFGQGHPKPADSSNVVLECPFITSVDDVAGNATITASLEEGASFDSSGGKDGAGALRIPVTNTDQPRCEYTPSSEFLLEASDSYSIEFWFKLDAQPPSGHRVHFFNRRDTSAPNRNYNLYYDPDGDFTHYGFAASGGVQFNDNTLSPDTWYHYAISSDGTTVRSYLNGVQQASSTSPEFAETSGSAPLCLGFIPSFTGDDCDGYYIDDFRFIKGEAIYNGSAGFVPQNSFGSKSLEEYQVGQLFLAVLSEEVTDEEYQVGQLFLSVLRSDLRRRTSVRFNLV